MASVSRLVVLVLVLVLLATAVSEAARRRKYRRRRRQNVAKAVSFGRLQAAGCLPADFQVPDMAECVAAGQASGGLRETLRCLAESLQIVNSMGLNEEGIRNFVMSLSEGDNDWRGVQLGLMEQCRRSMMNDTIPAPQQGIYMLTCWRGLADVECRRSTMEKLGAEAGGNQGSWTGQALMFMDAGVCMKPVQGAYHGDFFMSCANETGVRLPAIDAGIRFVKRYMAVFESGNNDQATPDSTAVQSVDQQLALFKATVVCVMQMLGEANGDQINEDAMLSNVMSSQAPEVMKGVAQEIITQCALADRSADPFIECWFISAASGCARIKAHMMATADNTPAPGRCGGARRRRKQRRRRPNNQEG
ncbi:uncharacterized protein LOC119114014 [Pollicipes pollicipes]|uniref:uncharacterized protein LOC119114014 n=1 Tax=Pollicipes pollicipes TaxID=41117 RepID=UPI0018854E10|nr:uncharacterized protein LOC119114014 [Pollicipes pollicipes]